MFPARGPLVEGEDPRRAYRVQAPLSDRDTYSENPNEIDASTSAVHEDRNSFFTISADQVERCRDEPP